MAINYPTSLDNFSNPAGTDSLNSPSHSLQHTDANDAIEALQAKVGIGASPAGSATAGQVLTAQGGGTALWTTPDASGLVLLNTTSFSAVSSQSIDNVFSATYDNYKIVINAILATGTQAFNFRLRAGGSDNSTASSYLYHREGADGTTQLGDNNTQAQLFMANVTTGAQHIYTMDIRNPFATVATSFIVIGGHHQYTTTTTGYHNQTVSYDGFTVYPASSTITGSLSVFGYRKS